MNPDSFLETYRAALARLEATGSSGYLAGTVTSRWFESREELLLRELAYEMAYGSDGNLEKHVLIRRNLAGTPYFERIFLPRHDRKLILERLDATRPFYIRLITEPNEDYDFVSSKDRRDKIARAAYSIAGLLMIPAILSSPSFRIIELTNDDLNGMSVVRAAYRSGSDAARSLPEMDGWLLLDPSRDWALLAYEVRMTWPAAPCGWSVVSGTNRYRNGAGADPFPEEVTIVERFSPPERPDEHRLHFRAHPRSIDSPSAHDFTLAAYDLGDYKCDVDSGADAPNVGQLNVHSRVLDFDLPAADTSVDLSFQLTNSGPEPIRVVGMMVGCGFLLPAEDLPCRIEPGQTRKLTLKRRPFSESDTCEIKSTLCLYTTAPGQAKMELMLVGRRNAGDR